MMIRLEMMIAVTLAIVAIVINSNKNNITILKKGPVTWSAVPILLSVLKWATSN